MRTTILIVFLCAACRSGTTYWSGGPAADRVKKALAQPQERDGAALSTGRVMYLIPEGALSEERAALLYRLRTAEMVDHAWFAPRDVEVETNDGAKVIAYTRPQVFEAGYPDGILHVERRASEGKTPTRYVVSFGNDKDVYTVQVRASPQLEGTWRALFEAARKQSRADSRVELLPTASDSPLKAMRDIGVDIRGIEPE